jgi:hypothetical protein
MKAKTQTLAGLEFWLVGSLEIQRNATGTLEEYSYSFPEGQRTNPYAAGPFCRFGLPAAPSAEGVYAIFVEEELKYIGECVDLAARFGPRGYGLISPRNIHNDGQSTNCKINSRVLAAAKEGHVAQVWFHATSYRKEAEIFLMRALNPSWNGRGTAPTRTLPATTLTVPVPTPTRAARIVAGAAGQPPVRRENFDVGLRTMLEEAAARGLRSITISAGDLHRRVGGYPGTDHRMPVCCASMRAAMRSGDRYVYRPPKGNGAKLAIEYYLPR